MGKIYKHMSVNTYGGHEMSSVTGTKTKSALDGDFLVTAGKKKNYIACYAMRLDVQGEHVIYYGPTQILKEIF